MTINIVIDHNDVKRGDHTKFLEVIDENLSLKMRIENKKKKIIILPCLRIEPR